MLNRSHFPDRHEDNFKSLQATEVGLVFFFSFEQRRCSSPT